MAQAGGGMVRVWDPVVRIGHWVLVVCFATAYLTEGEPEWLHTWAGYLIAIVVVLRVIWGFVGPRRARFSDFVTGPAKVVGYVVALIAGRSPRYLGHSPAGGAMTVALLLCLAGTAVTGMATYAAEEGKGPLAGIVPRVAVSGGEEGAAPVGEAEEDEEHEHGAEAAVKEVHEVLANLTLALVILHLAGVGLASWRHRENLARSMVTGRKRA